MTDQADEKGVDRTSNTSLRPALYVASLVLIAVGTYVFKLSTQGIFSCPADGYGEGWFLSYCNSTAYGDFDHGAFWYPLEPDAVASAHAAEVLLIGSSRMQFGFSTQRTRDWFANRKLSYYLLGFTHTENTLFLGPLVDRIAPTAKALIINADGFFQNRITSPTATLFAGGDAPARYGAKKNWQGPHRFLCGFFSSLCGDNYVIFRDISNGQWRRFGTYEQATASGVGEGKPIPEETWEENLDLAEEFLDRLQVSRECTLLTIVPSPQTPVEEAQWMSERLGIDLILPNIADLRTFDSSHLDNVSAERWSTAFFELASARLEKCAGANIRLVDSDQ